NVPPCPVGKWSNTSFPPCKDPFPLLESPPLISGPEIQGNNSFGFICEVVCDEDDPDQRFEVAWTFNVLEVVWAFDGQQDTSLPSQIISGANRSAILDGSYLKGHLNTMVGTSIIS
ncbi:unnamed protein product, partial [Candidula unifasciata]